MNGVPTPSRTSTSTNSIGIAAFSAGVTSAVITYQPMTPSCSPSFFGWDEGMPNAVRVPLMPGFETHVAQRCF